MKKTVRFAVIGSGWRSLFYWRIAKTYPELFQMTAMLCRTEEKAEKMKKEYGIPAVTSAKELREGKPQFAVVAVNKASIAQVTMEWAGAGYPVLCETPAALTLVDLEALWNLRKQGARIQVAEQYFLYPAFAAALETVKKGYLGEVFAVDLSAAHEYHGASLIRRFLGVGLENATLTGKKYVFPVEETDSRYGPVSDGRVSMRERVRMTFDFEGGKSAFYDFDGIQYHSFIRSRHLKLQGQRGELYDRTLRYVDKSHAVHEEFIREECIRQGEGIKRVLLGDEILYENPFYRLGKPQLLPQDETAVASLLLGMERYVEDGAECYPLAEALQDAYMQILMEEALKSGAPVKSEDQVWKIN